MPIWGENYRSYCSLCIVALRTYGHENVIGASVEAFARLATSHPETRFVYGEIGLPWGGPFPPHRTHENGLSVDYMTPLTGGRELPTHAWNRFGFDVEFDSAGRLLGAVGGRERADIDFDAIAAHLLALADAAEARGGRVRRVFFAPDLQDQVFAAENGAELRRRSPVNHSQSWGRHDDHYHVDFDFPCAPLTG